MKSIRTDLAMEMREIYQEGSNEEIPGVAVETLDEELCKITRVKVLDEEGEKIIGKPIGNYITIEFEAVCYDEMEKDEKIAIVLKNEIQNVLDKSFKNIELKTILVVGLGNWNVTPDALGPKVVEKIMVTRHILENIPEYFEDGTKSICAISPGVLGTTGIETSEIVKGVVENIKPNLVIAIDALASRRAERVNSTIQICDTGIYPGSGLGNKRKEISQKMLGVPVLSIGVPTVVDAATLANDTIDKVIDVLINETKEESSKFYSVLKDMDRSEKYDLIQKVLSPHLGNMVVTPKEIDEAIETVSTIVADGINELLMPGVLF